MSDQLATIKQAAGEISQGWSREGPEGLRITLAPMVSFTNNGIKYGLRIERERTTASGRQGKPTHIITLVNNPDESPADMLRILADVFDGHIDA